MKDKGGRPKRFEGDISTITFQLSKDMAEQFQAAAMGQEMSKSKFAEFLFKFWLAEKFKK